MIFFEGSEKKLEIIVNPAAAQLRQWDRAFWTALVQCAHADILSSMSNDDCDAYLLSESSLFVWDDRIVMLTCGNSRLVEAACYFIVHVNPASIRFLSYQRKNEYQAYLQPSRFADDIAQLRQWIPGKACRIGHLDSHHHYVFCSESSHHAVAAEHSLELLMYHIRGELADYLNGNAQSPEDICALLKLKTLFPQFSFDSHVFDPLGFSLNGLWGRYYITLHITPQLAETYACSYVSFETNLDLSQYPHPVVGCLLRLFSPVSWDVIGFNHPFEERQFPEHLCLGSGLFTTEHGYNIGFSHYQQLRTEALIPELM